MKKIALFLLMAFLTACTHQITFLNPQDGQSFAGQYNRGERSVSVTLPSGEVFYGKYVPLTNTTLTTGSLFNGTSVATGYMVTAGGASSGYAFLYGDKGTTMELVFQYSGRHGFGTAKTNKGEEYRIMF